MLSMRFRGTLFLSLIFVGIQQEATGFVLPSKSHRCFQLHAKYTPILLPPPPLPPATATTAPSIIDQLQHQLQDLYTSSTQSAQQLLDVSTLKDIQTLVGYLKQQLSSVDVSILQQLQTKISELLESLAMSSSSSSAASSSSFTIPTSLRPLLEQLSLPDSSSFTSLLQLLRSNTSVDILVASVITFVVASTLLNWNQAAPPTKPYPFDKYDPAAARAYFEQRPLDVIARGLYIATQSLQFGLALLQDNLNKSMEANEFQRGKELAELLTRLGPTFIKVGQSLSIRTDLLRPGYIRGLASLQDQVPPFDTKTATRILEQEWGRPVTDILSSPLTEVPVAAASLGQVYQATLKETDQQVAIKVQRPDIIEQIALDMHLLREMAPIFKRTFNLNSDTVGTVDAWGSGFVDELDYLQESQNAETFMEAIGKTPLADVVFAPTVLNEYSTGKVLVSEWIDGERLDKSSKSDVTVLCSIAMNTYLTMLLELGLLHCDPHPGNLLRTPDGRLCILDWGMVTRLSPDLQLTLIEHVAHLTSADYAEIPRDLLLLDFIPKEKAHLIKDSGVVEVLAGIYSSWTKGGGAAAVNVNDVVNQLQDLTTKNGNFFQLPAYFAYIAKSFSVLEGIGLSNDSNYSIIKECLPYISQRLLTDKDNLGPALTTFIFGPEKSNPDRIVDYDRVKQLVEGFGEFTSSSSGALLASENEGRVKMLDSIADKVLDLIFTDEPSPIQDIFLEQLAKIIASGSRTVFERVRERSGVLPSGRTVLGTIMDPLGLWRTSPLVRTNALDEKTVETTQRLIDLMQQQLQQANNKAAMDLASLSREETAELSSILTRKIWQRRSGVIKTGNLLTRQLIKLTADKLEVGERDSRRIPERRAPAPALGFSESDVQERLAPSLHDASISAGIPDSPRLEAARRMFDELRREEEEEKEEVLSLS
jgi:predicted unusual protein kinase regulating ubiquinone biosynthesis (AarF/ABC1/UbiB family)